MELPAVILPQDCNLRKYPPMVYAKEAIKTSIQHLVVYGLILPSGNRRQGNLYGQRHIAPVVGFHHLLAKLVAGSGGGQSDDRHSGERKHEGTVKAHLPPIALNHHLGKGNLLTAFCVNDLAKKYDRIARWPFGFDSFNKSCSYGNRFQRGGSWPASQKKQSHNQKDQRLRYIASLLFQVDSLLRMAHGEGSVGELRPIRLAQRGGGYGKPPYTH